MNGELVYRKDGAEVRLNLFEPDERGQAIIAELHGSGMSRTDPVLFCEATGRPQPVYLREVRGAIYASHFDGAACSSHSPSPMSDEHKRQVEYVVRAGDRAGHSVETEVSLGTGVRPDVVVRGTHAVAVEVQRSALSKHQAVTRTAKAVEAGLLTSAWISDRDYPNDMPRWFRAVPSVGMNRHLWDAVPHARGVTAQGLAEIHAVRCALPDFPQCPITKRRPCGRTHVKHEPWTGVTLDDVAERAPERGIVAVNWFDRYTLLVSPKSRALFEDVTGRSAEWLPEVRPTAFRKRRLIECAKPADLPSLLAASPALMEESPAATPSRPAVRNGQCGALADRRDSTRLCGRQARFYPCGWRCDEHRPGAA